ncbi:MAG TPA: nuclear transport factor 2 family protein [Pyrinomonadaceae bacterium]|nr:nuclear transport factor 2 family protein [Pyrinomonadaceae bacterium]
MKIVFTVITLISFAFLGSTHSNKDDVETELRKLVQTWDEAYVKSDTETLGGLLADEFEFVGGPKKADYLASFKTRQIAVASAVSSDLKVQVYDDAAIVTGLDTITIKKDDQNQVTKWLYLDVWIKRGGRWQCVKTYSAPLQSR